MYDALGNFRNLNLEQLHQHFLTSARQNQLRTPRFRINFSQDCPHPIVDAERLTADQFAAGQKAFGVIPQIDNDVIAGHFLDGAGQKLAFPASVLIRDLSTLCVSHALNDDLLGGLRRNPTKVDVFDNFFVVVAGLQCRVHLSGLFGRKLCAKKRQLGVRHHQPLALGHVVAGFSVDRDLNIGLFVVAFLGGSGQGQLDRFENNVL